jgi:hypothetical protein
MQDNVVVAEFNPLDWHNCVCPAWHWCTRHNAHGCAGRYLKGLGLPSIDLPDDFTPRRRIVVNHGKTIHGRRREWGNVVGCDNGLSKHSLCRLSEPDMLNWQALYDLLDNR